MAATDERGAAGASGASPAPAEAEPAARGRRAAASDRLAAGEPAAPGPAPSPGSRAAGPARGAGEVLAQGGGGRGGGSPERRAPAALPDAAARTARLLALDARLVAVAPRVKVLSRLSWPDDEGARFLGAWRKGAPRLPAVEPTPPAHAEEARALDAIAAEADPDDPLGRFLAATARSYAQAARLLDATGTPAFTELSVELYGRPDRPIGRCALTSLGAAEHLLATTDALARAVAADDPGGVPPERVAAELRAALDGFFGPGAVKVVLEPGLAAKAAAGAERIRVRASGSFSALDVRQLVEHEALVHALTLRNGRAQPRVRSLGLGAPRTTRTQEGLATLAELLTRTIDVARLRRLALRVTALARALEGADFVEVFRHFLEAGQTEQESFHSAQRLFRGGDPRGGRGVFTKDGVYLDGLLACHAFLRKAIAEERPDLVHRLFAGRLALGDALDLEPCFASGLVAPPAHEPPWVRDRPALAATLAFSLVAGRLDLDALALEDL